MIEHAALADEDAGADFAPLSDGDERADGGVGADLHRVVDESGVRVQQRHPSEHVALVDALLSRTVDVAWNTNLAYVKVHRRTSGKCRALASGIRTSVSPQKSSREPGAASRGSKI